MPLYVCEISGLGLRAPQGRRMPSGGRVRTRRHHHDYSLLRRRNRRRRRERPAPAPWAYPVLVDG